MEEIDAVSAPVPLSAEHDLSHFDCGEPMLNDWLRHRALKNESSFSRTYVVCVGARVVGYYCVSAGSVQRAAAPGKMRRNAPDAIPVSVIGRLAVSRDHAGKGLGRRPARGRAATYCARLAKHRRRRRAGACQGRGGQAVLFAMRGVHGVSDG
jgi:hypothetical protein